MLMETKMKSALLFTALLAAPTAFAGTTIVGDYKDLLNLPVVCRIDVDVNPGETSLCTGTLTEGRFVITAKHCFEPIIKNHLPLPKIVCMADGGRRVLAKQVIDYRFIDDKMSFNSDTESLADQPNDLAILSLEHTTTPETFAPKQIRVTTSEAETRELMNSHECIMSGYGLDNKDGVIGAAGGEAGILHTVIAPLKFFSGTADTITQLEAALAQDPNGTLVSSIIEKSKQEEGELAIYGGPAYLPGATFSDGKIHIVGDENMKNGSQPGDSGGPLFCAKKVNGEQEIIQVGVAISGTSVVGLNESIYSLLGRAAVQTWLKQSMLEMK
jgi:hypothetical protein